MAPITREQALENALVSSKMEGFPVTAQVRQNCKRLMNGEVTAQQLVFEMLEKHRETKQG